MQQASARKPRCGRCLLRHRSGRNRP
ncbi:hypothetical protein [Vibrio parahaemolyticus]